MLPALIASFALLLFVGELVFPFRRPPDGAGFARFVRASKNLGLAGLNALVSRGLGIGVAAVVVRYAPLWRPAALSGDVGMVFDFVVLDAWIYAWHRVVHAWPLAWRFHQVHHLDEAVDITTAIRFHAGDVMLSTLSRGVVVFALGISLYDVFLFEAMTVVASLFHHSNVRLPHWLDRVLSFVVVTPALHRVHHDPVREIHDSNYATILSLWDRALGTLVTRTSNPGDAPGLVGRHDDGIVELLVLPFRNAGARADSADLAELPRSG